jgi:transcriptional regulator with XRE-family HTH domain
VQPKSVPRRVATPAPTLRKTHDRRPGFVPSAVVKPRPPVFPCVIAHGLPHFSDKLTPVKDDFTKLKRLLIAFPYPWKQFTSVEKTCKYVLHSTQHWSNLRTMEVTFGLKLRELRQAKGLTLRALAEAAGVDFTYLSKMENDKVGYLPGADTIRDLASTLGVDAIELLQLAKKLPPELASLAGNANARRFFQRASEIASPKDWDELLGLLESRRSARCGENKKEQEKK